MSRITPNGAPVHPAQPGYRRCFACHKCEPDAPGSDARHCELRRALAGIDSGEGRLWTDGACCHWTRRVS